MNCASLLIACISIAFFQDAKEAKSPPPQNITYDQARSHEIEPHRRTVPMDGIHAGFNQLRLRLEVSTLGEVTDAKASGEDQLLEFWPALRTEVMNWKFTPFEVDGKPVAAEVEEYLDLVPPERLPTTHVKPPALGPKSEVSIVLSRSGCFGSCPSYSVTVTTAGIVFEGGGYVAAAGKHVAKSDPAEVRSLAKRFIGADFYSMADQYIAGVTDNPTYALSINIDGHKKQVEDYVGEWEGMPAIISELEKAVDEFADTERWISGKSGLIENLRTEKFNFKSFQAQVLLKEAAQRGQVETVQQLLEAGVPLKPLPAPKLDDPTEVPPFRHVGWLNASALDPAVLKVLIDAEASRDDSGDKDLALAKAANAGNLESVRQLLAYGADPNSDLSKLTVTEDGAGMTMEGPGAGSILIYAAHSGNLDLVHLLLSFHPKVDVRDREGKTALFAAGEYSGRGNDDDEEEKNRASIVDLLIAAGADVNARDNSGRTALHATFITPVEVALLAHGADVNAKDDDGETPIFTTVDDDAIPLFLSHGADLSIRNKKGETVVEAAPSRGPQRVEVLRKAIEETSRPKEN